MNVRVTLCRAIQRGPRKGSLRRKIVVAPYRGRWNSRQANVDFALGVLMRHPGWSLESMQREEDK